MKGYSMPLMSWKEEYSVKISQIDQQHKKLIDLINQLNDAMSQGKAKDVLGKILNDLVTYCADFAEHKEKHDKMTAKVFSLKREVEGGKRLISLEVMNFLEQWLDKHILGTDKKYGPFLNAQGIN